MAYTNLPKPHAVYFCVCVRLEASSEEATKVLGRIIVIEKPLEASPLIALKRTENQKVRKLAGDSPVIY